MAKIKTLAEVKEFMRTETVFETPTSFGVNDFGKYCPNITFIIPKEFEANPLSYRSDALTKEMLANMNLQFDGETSILFGDYWKSQKGGACFRPKPITIAQHVLVKISWGGAFNRSRGMYGPPDGALYYRHAASNGRGSGNDYLVVPIGFCKVVRDAEIDGEVTSAAPNFAERAKALREKFTQYDREQNEKASAEARAKAEAEAASKAAKAGLLPRIEAARTELEKVVLVGEKLPYADTVTFKWGWSDHLYTEANVAALEHDVARIKVEKIEQERKRIAREQFQPKFEVFNVRLQAVGLTVEFGEDRAKFANDYYSNYPYSEEGVLAFAKVLDQKEKEAAEARAKANAEAEYQQRKTEAVAFGLPTDIRIWRRRGGRTNAGDGWVIGLNGQDRPNTGWTDPSSRRLARYGEGEMIWEQILLGEVVLKWSKSCSAAEHQFEVVHLPAEGLTEAQLERIKEIQDELEKEWEDARGLVSGMPSPPVGDGWGLLPKSSPNPSGGTATLDGELDASSSLS